MRSFLSTEIDVTSPSTQLFGICGQFRSTSNLGAFGSDWASSPIDDAVMIKAADAANSKHFTVLFSPRLGLRLTTLLGPRGPCWHEHANICIAQVSRQRKRNPRNRKYVRG